MFKGFAQLRNELTSLVFLRRISRELHRIGNLLEERISLDHPAHYKATRKKSTSIKLSEITHPTIEQWNEAHRQRHPIDEDEDVFKHP